MLMPKKTKYRKQQKGRNRGFACRGCEVNFGEYGLMALDKARLTSRQIEAARRAIARCTRRYGKIYINVFPDKPITMKPLEVRQGKGKGSVEYWVFEVKPGRILFEIEGVDEKLARKAFRLAAAKFPLCVQFVKRSRLIEEGSEKNESE